MIKSERETEYLDRSPPVRDSSSQNNGIKVHITERTNVLWDFYRTDQELKLNMQQTYSNQLDSNSPNILDQSLEYEKVDFSRKSKKSDFISNYELIEKQRKQRSCWQKFDDYLWLDNH
jgi:hypothetical protein